MAACWFAAPAEAAIVPADLQAPVAGVAATADQSPIGNALGTAASEPAGAVERVVADAADAVAGTATSPPTVDSPVQTVPSPRPQATPSVPAAPQRLVDHGVRASASAAMRARGDGAGPGAKHRRGAAGAPIREARLTGPPTGSVTAKEVGGASHHAVTGPVPSAADDAGLNPASGAVEGSAASGASGALSFGGSAVLLAAVFLAASGLRRRIPGHRAICPPAAFIPLLERPG